MPRDRPLAALLIYVPALAVLAIAFWVTESFGVPFVTLTRDAAIAHTKDAPFYGGYLSNAGAVLWSSAAAVCFFTAATLPRGDEPARRERRNFLITLAALTAMLLVDDLFMVHEAVLQLAGRGQKGILLVQGGITLWMVWRYRALIRTATHWPLLGSALALFGASLAVDLDVVPVSARLHHVFEDGFKMLGIAGWCGYAMLTSAAFTRRASPSLIPAAPDRSSSSAS